MPGINLKTCPKTYILETHRSKAPDSTLRFIEDTKAITGLLSFRDAMDVDRLGIPVFTCHRIRPDNSKTSHTGKGVSKIQAQVSLMMEAIERYCSEYRDEYWGRLMRGSYNQLQYDHRILDPRELILPAFSDSLLDEDFYWISGFDIRSETEVLVPASSVYHPFHLDGSRVLTNTHTNGLASGNTLEEAVFHALTELIERDAWSIAKFHNEMDDALIVEDLPEHQFITDVIEKFENAQIQVTAKDITSDIGVPVVAAFSVDMVHPSMMPIDGFGAHLDPRVATARALLEIATTRALFIQKYGIEGLRESLPYYAFGEETPDPRFYASRSKPLGEIPGDFSRDILTDIGILAAKLEARGLGKVIVVDLTRPDVPVPTVRVIVPGLEVYCFDRLRKGERLFTSRGVAE